MVKYINSLDSHQRLYWAISITLLTWLMTSSQDWDLTFIFSWLAFSATVLAFNWISFFTIHPQELHKKARLQDNSRFMIFIFIIIASVLSLFTIIVLVISTKEKHSLALIYHILLTIASVICSWFLVHTIFTLRYAHLYYTPIKDVKGSSDITYAEGLDFPKEAEPDYLDFCYFSFGVGTTFQVSDISVTSSKIRRLILVHSLISFAYNTVIVALSINILSGLVGK
jgi:uncharacterized membrane protein